MSPTIGGGGRGASAASRHRGTATRGLLAAWLTSERADKLFVTSRNPFYWVRAVVASVRFLCPPAICLAPGTMAAPAGKEKKKRAAPTPRACDSCKKMKRRCSGGVPCEQCVRKKVESTCHYSEPRRRGPKKGWAERLKQARAQSAGCHAKHAAQKHDWSAGPVVRNGAVSTGGPSPRTGARGGGTGTGPVVCDPSMHAVDFKLIDEYFDKVHQLLPVCTGADVRTAVIEVQRPTGPNTAAHKGILLGLQACGCFFTGNQRLPMLIDGVHSCAKQCFTTPSLSSIRALLIGSWAAHYMADQGRAAALTSSVLQLTVVVDERGDPPLPPTLRGCCALAESWLASTARPPHPFALTPPTGHMHHGSGSGQGGGGGGGPGGTSDTGGETGAAVTATTIRHGRFLAIIAHLRPRVTAYLQGAPSKLQPTPAEYLKLCAELATLEAGGLRLGPISTVWRLALTGCGQVMSKNFKGAEVTFSALHQHCSVQPVAIRFPDSLMLVHDAIACMSTADAIGRGGDGRHGGSASRGAAQSPPKVASLLHGMLENASITYAPLAEWLLLRPLAPLASRPSAQMLGCSLATPAALALARDRSRAAAAAAEASFGHRYGGHQSVAPTAALEGDGNATGSILAQTGHSSSGDGSNHRRDQGLLSEVHFADKGAVAGVAARQIKVQDSHHHRDVPTSLSTGSQINSRSPPAPTDSKAVLGRALVSRDFAAAVPEPGMLGFDRAVSAEEPSNTVDPNLYGEHDTSTATEFGSNGGTLTGTEVPQMMYRKEESAQQEQATAGVVDGVSGKGVDFLLAGRRPSLMGRSLPSLGGSDSGMGEPVVVDPDSFLRSTTSIDASFESSNPEALLRFSAPSIDAYVTATR